MGFGGRVCEFQICFEIESNKMEPTPDFSRYSTPDLRDAIAHINAEKFPHLDRAAREELARREKPNRPIPSKADSSGWPIILAILLTLWGANCVGFGLYAQFTPPQPGYRNDFEPWFLILIGVGPLALGIWSLMSHFQRQR